jgi:1,2-diacylglycerol 3-beta-galactosyltransferase
MKLSDFFIGKPGPGSISEAVHQGLPIIVVRNSLTMPQERYNTEWVQQNGVGVVLDSFRSVRAGVDEVIRHLDAFRSRIARIENRAIFEIPEIIAGLLDEARAPSKAPLARAAWRPAASWAAREEAER